MFYVRFDNDDDDDDDDEMMWKLQRLLVTRSTYFCGLQNQ